MQVNPYPAIAVNAETGREIPELGVDLMNLMRNGERDLPTERSAVFPLRGPAMNKLVVTMAAGVYMVAPAPGSVLAEQLSVRFSAVFAEEAVVVPPRVVGINGGGHTQSPTALTQHPAPPTRSCTRTMTLSISKMLSTALTDECAVVQNPQTGYENVVTVGYSSGT